jgi:prepilin-type N-terminal cleavage/methylation domain-containing protein
MRFAPRAGFTLVEVMVSMLVSAVGLGVVTTALLTWAPGAPKDDPALQEWRASRAQALLRARAAVIWPDSGRAAGPVLFLPDGRVVGDTLPTLPVDSGPPG